MIIDTAGRLGIDSELMAQAEAIRDATDPDEVLFVVDAMIGQDAVATAQAFLDGVGYDGVVLTKLDGDARGGAALSIAALTGKPVMFASTGEKLSDFDVFHPDRMATRILDMGDVLSLIERAEKAFDAEQTASIAERMMSGEGFTLEDFVEQLSMLRKLGPLKNILGMMPGASKNKALLDQVNDKDLDRAEAIVRSMTPAGAAYPQDHQRLAPAAHRQRLRRHRRRGLPAGHELLRGPEADEDADGRRDAGHAGRSRAWRAPPGARPRPPRRRRTRRASAAAATPARPRSGRRAVQGGTGRARLPCRPPPRPRTRRSRWRSWPRCSARPRRAAARSAWAAPRAASPASAAAARLACPRCRAGSNVIPAAFGKRNKKKK